MSEKGKKVLNIFKRIGIGLSIGFNVVFLIAVIIGSSGLKKQNNNVNCALAESDIQVSEKVDFKYENKKFITYEDDSFNVLFYEEDLQYSYINTFNYIYSLGSNEGGMISVRIYYADNTKTSLAFTSLDSSSVVWSSGSYSVVFSSTGFITCSQDVFSYVRFNIPSVITDGYSNFKNNVELDYANATSDINDGIFETLTDSVVSFVGSLGSGIVAMTSIFYDSVNNNLTTIGLLSVIVVAVTLSYFFFRLIIGLIRMRG